MYLPVGCGRGVSSWFSFCCGGKGAGSSWGRTFHWVSSPRECPPQERRWPSRHSRRPSPSCLVLTRSCSLGSARHTGKADIRLKLYMSLHIKSPEQCKKAKAAQVLVPFYCTSRLLRMILMRHSLYLDNTHNTLLYQYIFIPSVLLYIKQFSPSVTIVLWNPSTNFRFSVLLF